METYEEIRALASGPMYALLNRAFEARKCIVGWELTCVFPGSGTLPVSLSGSRCNQKCMHCDGHYLTSMTDLDQLIQGMNDPEFTLPESILVSGGCLTDMRLPLIERADDLRQLRRAGVAMNFHVAIPDSQDMELILELADVVSLDFVPDPQVAGRVFRTTRASAGTFENIYQTLSTRLRVIPHVCVGLDQGRIGWEYHALEVLAELGAGMVTLNVIRPTVGTEFADVTPPAPQEVARVVAAARLLMPGSTIGIGCMRPGGALRRKMDNLCLMAGADRIVSPLPATVSFAEQLGLYVTPFDKCCAFPNF